MRVPLGISRRGLVKGSALLLVGSTSRSVGTSAESLGFETLRVRRAELVAQCEDLDCRWLNGQSRMPAHFLLGAKYRTAQGDLIGPRVGWPDALLDAIQLPNGLLLARPSPHDLWELFDADVRDHGRDVAAANYGARVRQLRERLRERRRLQSELSMPRTRDWQPLDDEIDAIDLLISSFPTNSVTRD